MSPRLTKGIMSPEARRKMSEAKKRFYSNPANRARWSGPNSSQWGPKNLRWKGGKIKMGKLGYIKVLCHGHPGGDKDGYVLEHRLIMELRLGRYLRHDEHVHHINGIRNDNRLENLILMSEGEHHRLHTSSIPRENGRLTKKAREANCK